MASEASDKASGLETTGTTDDERSGHGTKHGAAEAAKAGTRDDGTKNTKNTKGTEKTGAAQKGLKKMDQKADF